MICLCRSVTVTRIRFDVQRALAQCAPKAWSCFPNRARHYVSKAGEGRIDILWRWDVASVLNRGPNMRKRNGSAPNRGG